MMIMMTMMLIMMTISMMTINDDNDDNLTRLSLAICRLRLQPLLKQQVTCPGGFLCFVGICFENVICWFFFGKRHLKIFFGKHDFFGNLTHSILECPRNSSTEFLVVLLFAQAHRTHRLLSKYHPNIQIFPSIINYQKIYPSIIFLIPNISNILSRRFE